MLKRIGSPLKRDKPEAKAPSGFAGLDDPGPANPVAVKDKDKKEKDKAKGAGSVFKKAPPTKSPPEKAKADAAAPKTANPLAQSMNLGGGDPAVRADEHTTGSALNMDDDDDGGDKGDGDTPSTAAAQSPSKSPSKLKLRMPSFRRDSMRSTPATPDSDASIDPDKKGKKLRLPFGGGRKEKSKDDAKQAAGALTTSPDDGLVSVIEEESKPTDTKEASEPQLNLQDNNEADNHFDLEAGVKPPPESAPSEDKESKAKEAPTPGLKSTAASPSSWTMKGLKRLTKEKGAKETPSASSADESKQTPKHDEQEETKQVEREPQIEKQEKKKEKSEEPDKKDRKGKKDAPEPKKKKGKGTKARDQSATEESNAKPNELTQPRSDDSAQSSNPLSPLRHKMKSNDATSSTAATPGISRRFNGRDAIPGHQPEVHLIGEILGGKGFGKGGFACKWSIEYGKAWIHIAGDQLGQSQIDYAVTHLPGDDSLDVIWCHPIDLHFATLSLQGWPKLLLQVWHIDAHMLANVAGYGFVHVPFAPGEYDLDVALWRPMGSGKQELEALFLGRTPELTSDNILFNTAWEERCRLKTVATGHVRIHLGVLGAHILTKVRASPALHVACCAAHRSGSRAAYSAQTVSAPKTRSKKKDDDDARFRLALLPGLRVFHELEGHFAVPRQFVIPPPHQRDLWPRELHGVELGQLVHGFVRRNIEKQDPAHLQALSALGFPFQEWKQYKWNVQFMPAFKTYLALHGNLMVPQQFVVPFGDAAWPRPTWSMKLGHLVNRLRIRRDHTLSDWQCKELEELGFVWNEHDAKWNDLFMPSLRAFYEIHGHSNVPGTFIVPPHYQDTRWPPKCAGYRLGCAVNNLRAGHYTSQAQACADELAQLEFSYDTSETRWYQQILPALQTFSELYGHCLVNVRFVVPEEEPWPQKAWGLKLGRIVHLVRSRGDFEEHATASQEILSKIGFVWNVKADRWKTFFLPALTKFRELEGHCRVPQSFAVPEDDPEWPEHLWGYRLGQTVNIVRAGAFANCVSESKAELEALGFSFSISDTKWTEEILPALQRYVALHETSWVPVSFVVPESPSWPAKSWGLKLGVTMQNIRLRGDFAAQVERDAAILLDMGVVIANPKSKPRDSDDNSDSSDDHESMKAIVHASVFLIKAYIQLVLYVPKLIIQLNWQYNPFLVVARKFLQRVMLVNVPAGALADGGLDADHHAIPPHSGPPPTTAAPAAPLTATPQDKQTPSKMTDTPSMRWLKPGEYNGEHVAIVSYPRSGNSLMRGLLEKITGVYTGCDTRPDRSLSQELQNYGMKGEGVVDDSVWFVKTHFPERTGWKPFKIKKAILVVRNPWDAIDSYFNMTLTNTHNKSLHESQYERFAERWDGLLRNEIDVWMKFHRYWTSKVDIPIIVVRYEDLLVHRAETLRRVFLFLTDKPSIEGTEWKTRIRDVMATSGENSGPYVPRSGKIGGSFRHYSEEQFQYILKTANLPLRGFGYDPVTQDFPNQLPIPRRQVKPASQPGNELEISIDLTKEIRKRNDAYGRLSTYYRKALTDPVIASDGTELNMDEVEFARQLKHQKEEKKAAAAGAVATNDSTPAT
ncbi:TPA: hypothetical protein N0F65_001112 [Lagenidium giganteum]|uniref:Sulfotransferase domain-containing protein n=1 Tax=Lagenidium giganteum TaxID=4803 RepID=A0AAV2YM83_9STRA|nr:TPA: hypothetical protein N0F65_001112 [Lagenidium giganteum]